MGTPLPRRARQYLRDRLRPTVTHFARLELDRSLRSSPLLPAKSIPLEGSDDEVAIARVGRPSADRLAIPPRELWEHEDFETTGAGHAASIRSVMSEVGYPADRWGSVLELGCGSGRVTRHFSDIARAGQGEFWGVDINETSIIWCQQHLTPPFRFAPCSTLPHLPFEDGRFGFVYATSVFSHISEMVTSWLLELRRTVRPGGHLFITIMDQSYVRRVQESNLDHWTARLVRERAGDLAELGVTSSMLSIGRASKNAMVYYDRSYVLETWGQFFEIVDVREDAFDFQTAIVLRA